MKILLTGGIGFIGTNLSQYLLELEEIELVVVDNLSYASNQSILKKLENNDNFYFEKLDICDRKKLEFVFQKYKPDCIMHLAAESHVDNSIASPKAFINTNIIGTFNLLEISLKYWLTLQGIKKNNFRFHHVSSDEVYGDIEKNEAPSTEKDPYRPSSPYSASKASSDHLVRAWFRTYNLPILLTNCSNNYGPFQHHEKLIPKIIFNAVQQKNIPVYGDGKQIRDWIYVKDHVRALYKVLTNGRIGETYNIGSNCLKTNIEVVNTICEVLDNKKNILNKNNTSYKDLITFVDDRHGHDKKYAIDSKKISNELDWEPYFSFSNGIDKTINWYLEKLFFNNKTLIK